MELIFPSIAHKQAALEYRQEHFDEGIAEIHGDGGLDHAGTYEDWLELIKSAETWEVTEERVPATVYFGIENGRIVGMIQIRHKLNQYMLNTHGHIGYGVRPSERRKGCATQMLSLALEKCREMGMTKVMISCDKDNIGSARTIIKNGGVLEREIEEENGYILQQYWIDLSD